MSAAMEAIDRLVKGRMTSQQYGQALLAAQGLDSHRLVDAAPIDDEIDPVQPTGLVAEGFLKSLTVSWDDPPIKDYVTLTTIELKHSTSGAVTVYETKDTSLGIGDLDYATYEVRIKHTDLWNRVSPWSVVATGRPRETAEYKIDFEKASLLGNISNLMPSINTELINGATFAEDTVRQVSLAQPDAPNQLPLIEVDFDQWNNNQAWPPLDADTAGTPYITSSFDAGNTASVVIRAGQRWLAETRDAGALGGAFFPFSKLAQRGTHVGQEYIMSTFVDGTPGNLIRMEVQGANSATAPTSFVILGSVDATISTVPGLSQRIYTHFAPTAAHPFIRVKFTNLSAGSTVYLTKMQLEKAQGKSEPGSWTPGVFSTGVIASRLLTAIDVVAARGLFKTAAIEDAMIKSIKADTIETSSLTSSNITLAGGKLLAGKVSLGSFGMSMPAALGQQAGPSADSDYRISTGPLGGEWADFSFFNDAGVRGARIRADGVSGGDRGRIAFIATPAGDMGASTTVAMYFDTSQGFLSIVGGLAVSKTVDFDAGMSVTGAVNLLGTSGAVQIGQPGALKHLNAFGDINVSRNLDVAGRILPQFSQESTSMAAATTELTWSLTGNTGVPRLVFGQYLDGGNWINMGGGGAVRIGVTFNTSVAPDTQVKVLKNDGLSHSIRWYVLSY